jgi:peroxiredoxin
VTLRLLVYGLCWSCLAAATAAEQPADTVLHLTNGGFVRGELLASPDAKVLRWHSPVFAKPLEFPLSALNSVQYPVPGQPPRPAGEYCFELVDDDVAYGNLLSMTEDELEVDAPGIGRLHLKRDQVRRLYRWKGADSIYLGPNGLAGWQDMPAGRWREEGGQLLTDHAGASLFCNLGLPEKAMIEVELSWKRRPNFILALGTEEREAAAPHGFHIEVWDDQLVAVGEAARDADVAGLQRLGPGDGQIRVQAYLDQGQGTLTVLSRAGKPLATLRVSDKKPQTHPGIRLTNKKGDVRLEYLRVTRWNGLAPREAREDQSRVHRADGSIVYGQLVAFDLATRQFTLSDGTNQTTLKQDEIADVFLTPWLTPGKAAGDAAPRAVRIAYRDGSRFSGMLSRVEDKHITLACPGVKEPLRLAVADLRSLIGLQHGGSPAGQAVTGKAGRLELDGVSLKGRLVSGTEQPGTSCLVWHPDLGVAASPLLPGVAGRVVYREPPPARTTATQPQRLGGVVQGRVIMKVEMAGGPATTTPSPATTRPPSSGRRSLHLRSGDTIPCEVIRIDEKGLYFKTPISDATFVPHEKIKGVELVASQTGPRLDEAKRDRLLTLPRLQKDAPPSHLICSKNGDFLRGRVLEMDANKLKAEVRLETKEIPRDRVAQIIWLHADELTGKPPVPAAAQATRKTRVQALRADGNRLTFVAEKADPRVISGTSDVIGACRADLLEVDQLLFGAHIEESAAKLAYHAWRLHPAPEPKFVQAGSEGAADGRPSGIDSPLVGQPAFAFRLDRLDGSRFQLADQKGRVVVLDFWATWCGPCMQSLPLIDEVAREFADRGVELVAVNMEEQPGQVKSVLERHKLKVPVVLDRDGVVAAKYSVTAIPQTVVIDREGKVARLFVGGGNKTAEALRKALQELTGPPPMP